MLGSAFACIGRLRVRIEGPIGNIDPVQLPAFSRVFLQSIWREPKASEPRVHRLFAGFLVQSKRQQSGRLDVSMCSRIRNDRRCAKRAFERVKRWIKFDGRAAILAGKHARLFNGVGIIGMLQSRFKITLFVRSLLFPWRGRLKRLRASAMVARQPVLAGLEPQIRSAGLTGKSMFLDIGAHVRARWRRFALRIQ